MTQTLTLQTANACYVAAADRFAASGGVGRLWRRDPTVWTGADEADWLGWLDLTDPAEAALAPLRDLAAAAQRESVEQVVVMGMGGSSLCRPCHLQLLITIALPAALRRLPLSTFPLTR